MWSVWNFGGQIADFVPPKMLLVVKVYTVNSLLTNTSVKRTPRVGPSLCLLLLFDSL